MRKASQCERLALYGSEGQEKPARVVEMGLIPNLLRPVVQGFANPGSEKKDGLTELLVLLLSLFLSILILSLIGKMLWNNVIVDLFDFAKPAKSFWQMLGLLFFLAIMLP